MTFFRTVRLEDMLLYKWEHGHETYEHYITASEEIEALKLAKLKEDPQADVNVGQIWQGHVHDSDRGRVNSVVISFDDSFMFSAGNDGGLFVWRLVREKIRKGDGKDVY